MGTISVHGTCRYGGHSDGVVDDATGIIDAVVDKGQSSVCIRGVSPRGSVVDQFHTREQTVAVARI